MHISLCKGLKKVLSCVTDYPVYDNFKKVHLSNCSLRLQDLSFLAECVELEELDLIGEDEQREKYSEPDASLRDVSMLAKFRNLKVIKLGGCSNVQDLSGLASCIELEVIDLCRCVNLKDVDILSRCLKLKEVHLSHCPDLYDLSGLASCSKLRILDLSH